MDVLVDLAGFAVPAISRLALCVKKLLTSSGGRKRFPAGGIYHLAVLPYPGRSFFMPVPVLLVLDVGFHD
ncbi:hypothetical protein NZJ93_00315 [Desulfofundulus thermocisternus]|nr:hypothetical protein [Desulfofundulus thermocisternus]